MSGGVSIDVTLSGKLLKGDAQEHVKGAIRDTIEDIVQRGQEDARGMAGSFRKTGRYIDSLKGRVAKTGKSGRIKSYGVVAKTYARSLERGAPPPRQSFKGYAVLRRTRDKLQSGAEAVLQEHVNALTGKLNA